MFKIKIDDNINLGVETVLLLGKANRTNHVQSTIKFDGGGGIMVYQSLDVRWNVQWELLELECHWTLPIRIFYSLDGKVVDESTDEPTNELNEYRMDNEQNELQDIEPSSIITPDDWENQLRDWEQMLIDEKAERDNNGNMEGDLLSNYKHPAIDNRAKWESFPTKILLLTIFAIAITNSLPNLPPSSTGFDSRIKNVVLLVMENRSFSKIAGYFRYSSEIKGLTGREYNLVDPSDQKSKKIYATQDAVYIDSDDPGHSVNDTFEQISGYPGDPRTKFRDIPPMSGFVQNLIRNYKIDVKDEKRLKHVMNAFNPDDVPVIHTLAKNFALFDRWFASIPGSTVPNRLFIHSATSNGVIETSYDAAFNGFDQRSLYDSFNEANITWKNYFSFFPSLTELRSLRKDITKFKKLQSFLNDAKNGKLPQFSFIDAASDSRPCYNGTVNDEHPPYSVADGELFIKQIYEALHASPQWNQSLFILTFDEHGGFYDPVPPPENVPAPDNKTAPYFNFDRLGVRVPTILISPWIAKGKVVHDPILQPGSYYEHSSIAATMKRVFNLPNFLTKRLMPIMIEQICVSDAWAGTFEHIWSKLPSPRTDTPVILPSPPENSPASSSRKRRRSEDEFSPEACAEISKFLAAVEATGP
ncbi:hypothetical protein G9A89_003683 [Geosiphon pyriformis]|nr:hypothetical protein G9A89_003683 [Geosiphon pyriformis]